MRDTSELRRLWRLPLKALGFNLHEASELAAVLEEAAPDVDFFNADEKEALRSALSSRSHAPSSIFTKRSLHDRIRMAVPECTDEGVINWNRLSAAVSTESLSQAAAAAMGSGVGSSKQKMGAAVQLELNSGGRVFFLLFRPPEGVLAGSEGLAVVKFAPSRLLMQAEQFANELTRHLGICAPSCRIVRQAGATSSEWQQVVDAVSKLGGKADGLDSELAALPCFLLMQFIRGKPLLECSDAFEGMHVPALFEDLGRLFLLDMVLGNADRLPCIDLGWRGNPNNIMHGARGTQYAGRAVAIDSCVQRRPPAARLSHEDAAVDRLAQLLLNDAAFALAMLRGGLMAGSRGAVAALAARPGAYVSSFQHGFRSCLEKVVAIKGLLEMIRIQMSDWVLEFLTDIKQHKPQLQLPGSSTPKNGLTPGTSGGRVLRRPFSASPSVAPQAAGGGGGTRRSQSTKTVVDRDSPAEGGSSAEKEQLHQRPFSQPRLGSAFSTPRERAPAVVPEEREEDIGSPAAAASTAPAAPPVAGSPGPAAAAAGTEHDSLTDASSADRCMTPGVGGRARQASPSSSPGDSSSARRQGSVNARGTPRIRPQSTGGGQTPLVSPGRRQGQAPEDSDMPAQATPVLQSQPSSNLPPVAQDAITYYQGQGQANLNLTLALKVVRTEAKHDDIVSERMQHWTQVFRERGVQLRQAVEEWTARNGVAHGVLTTGFLDGTHPLVDIYELKVRLDHMLRRLRVLEEAASARAPAKILPGLFVGSAVSADSHHVLRHLGITHIVNSTQEVLPPPDKAGFKVLVVPLRDTDDEDIMTHFTTVNEFIEDARGRPAKTPPPDPLLMLQQAPPTKPSMPVRKQHPVSTPERSNLSPSHTPPPAKASSGGLRVSGSPLAVTSAAPPVAASSIMLPLRPRFSDNGISSPRQPVLTVMKTPERRLIKRHSACGSPRSPTVGEPLPAAQQLSGTASPNAQRVRRPAAGGSSGVPTSGVLVHCSEGKSRSVTLILNYLMQVQGWTLKDALLHTRRCRPIACPNAGFMAKLVELDVQLHGRASLRPEDAALGLKRGKPEPRVCPVCSAKVGVSTASLMVHMKAKHPDARVPDNTEPESPEP